MEIKFSEEETRLLLDALHFASCTDVCMNVDFERGHKMADLANKIILESKLVPSQDLYYHEDVPPEDGDILAKIKDNMIGKR